MSEQNTEQDSPAVEPQKFDDSYIKSLRDEAAKYRTERNSFKQQVDDLSGRVEKLSKLEELLAGKNEDPQKAIEELKKENRSLKLQHTFSKVSKALNADEELTYAALSAKGLLNDIDPSKEDELSELVKKAIEGNPKLKATMPTKAGDNGAEDTDKKGFDFNHFIRSKGR